MQGDILPLLHSKKHVDEAYADSSEYLRAENVLRGDISSHYWALHCVWDVIPQDELTILRSSHSFPMVESQSKFDSAIELALEGFYFESLLTLRSCYELGLLSIYFNKDDQGPNNIREWAIGNADTPVMKTVKRELQQLQCFNEFDLKFDLFSELDVIYKTLNDFTHTKGIRHSARGIARESNVNHFEERAFLQWWDVAHAVARSVVLVHAIRYPLLIKRLNLSSKFGIDIPFGYFLDDGHVDLVRQVIPSDRLTFIELLLEKDQFSQDVIADIASLPDMTEYDLREQRFRLNRSYIEMHPNGFEGWFEYNNSVYQRFDPEVFERFLSEAFELRVWAEENGLMTGREPRPSEDSGASIAKSD